MFSPGIRNPQRSLLICLAITLAACASIAWGVIEMNVAGQETLGSGLKIGIALLPAILAPFMALNFWGGTKVMASMRRGENAIARWTVTAADLAEFTTIDKVRSARGIEHLNDWPTPREPPPSGIEIVFTPSAVLVGDTYFSLTRTGPFRFTGVRLLSGSQPVIAFSTLTTYANRFNTRTMAGELRIPASQQASAAAAKVVTHFEQVAAGTIIADPNFYRRRMRIGLIAAPIFFAIAAAGFVLSSIVGDNSGFDPTILIAIGLVFGIASLILAGGAWLLGRAQLRKR
ncbi:MAG: hypothetical protein Q8R82_15980 [Hyphomonadaceae bacterium]|nr:hypothetical protein [Hyphomonadaceae bacterium]